MTVVNGSDAYLEDVKDSTCVEAGLLVDSVEERGFLALVGEEGGGQVKLEALGNLVLELDLGLEDVGGRPRLGEHDAVLVVGVLGLNVGTDGSALVLATGDLEGDARGGFGLNLEAGARVIVVASQQVVGRLAKVLFRWRVRRLVTRLSKTSHTFQEGGTGWGRKDIMDKI